MKKLLSLKTATAGILIILSLIIIFHLLVISSLVPSAIVWGGTVVGENQLWVMESIAIAINLVMLLFVAVYAGIIKAKLHRTILKAGFWILFAFFLLNTLGNLLAMHSIESYIFTPLTLLLALFCFRIANSFKQR